MPAPTDIRTVAAASTVNEPAAAATFTERADTPSPTEVWAPCVLPSASTDRSITRTSSSATVSDALVTDTPAAEAVPVMSKASASAAVLSSVVERVNVPDPDPAPAAIVTSKVSSPGGIV